MNKLYESAKKVIPSGVNSPVRAFKAVGGDPVFIRRGKGPWIWDESGKKYLDFCASWGPLILGHAPEGLSREIHKAMKLGTSFGAPTAKEVELARCITDRIPSMEKVRMTSSGTEAVMSAIRLARGFTKRKKIVKIDGGYHGHVDSLLVKAGSGAATFGVPDSAGIPEELSRLTLSIPFNDTEALERVFRQEGGQIAAFILEPIPANMGVVLPQPGYLQKARTLTARYGALLIFDEVISGFRVGPAGAQGFYRVRPDLTCLGKIVGGGFPLAVFGGRADVMDYLAPAGPVYQAGTLSGNPIAVTAALWMLKTLKTSAYQQLQETSSEFLSGLQNRIYERALPVCLNRQGSMFTLFFTQGSVTDYASAKKSDTQKFARFFHVLLQKGIYTAPAQFEANFISTVHTPGLLAQALKAFDEAFRQVF